MSIVSHRLSQRVVHLDARTGGRDRHDGQGSTAATGRYRTRSGATAAGPAGTLAALGIGARATIAGFSPQLRADVARRLFDLGFVPGTTVEAARRAPLRDPVLYRVSGVEVALRASESRGVLLTTACVA